MEKVSIVAKGTLLFIEEGEYNFSRPSMSKNNVVIATTEIGLDTELKEKLNATLKEGNRVVLEFDSQQSDLRRGRVSIVAIHGSEKQGVSKLTVQIYDNDLKDVNLR